MITTNRGLIIGALISSLVLIWTVRLLPWDQSAAWTSTKETLGKLTGGDTNGKTGVGANNMLPVVEAYFDQAFSVDKPRQMEYEGIVDYCSHVEFKEDVYVDCIGMAAGLTSIISQVKVCLKMAIDSGSNLLLPSMPLRDSKDLLNFNFLNEKEHYVYDKWFDVDHLRDVMHRSCPNMKIMHPEELAINNGTVPIKHDWQIYCKQAPGYHDFNSLFWVGKPYGPFFDLELSKLQLAPDENQGPEDGITKVMVDSKFLIYRILDDASGRELRLWNDLSNAIRFLEDPRRATNILVDKLETKGPYYGIHFRTENDTIWSSFENQLAVDLDALDEAWEKFGNKDEHRPWVYLACGDEQQAERFVVAGQERGWNVTHKWKLLADDEETTKLINSLPFDFQGAIDLGIMVRSQFFFGITGSAFSSTLSNLRDPTGRYRGSSFMVPDDAGARTHLFNDGNSAGYPCCL